MSCEFCSRQLAEVKLAQNKDIPWCGECEDYHLNMVTETYKSQSQDEKEPEQKWRLCDKCGTSYSTIITRCVHCGSQVREIGDTDFVKTPKRVTVGTGDIAKYPFLMEAKEYVQYFDYDVLGRPENYRIIQRAAERIKLAFDGQYDINLENHTIELLTFVTELTMLKLTGLDKLSQKLALSEARRVEQFLIQDLKQDYAKMSDITQSLVLQILEHEFNLKVIMKAVNIVNNGKRKEEAIPVKMFAIHIRDWALHTSQFHEQEWKLINRLVIDGWVFLEDVQELIRLVRVELYMLILSKLKEMKVSDKTALPEMLVLASDYVRQEYLAKFEKRFMVTGEAIPPCVRHIMDMLNRGENVSHQGRILLASYMAAIGKSVDEICEMFKHAPDYNERITRQQVGFIADNKRLGRAYHVSGCDKLKSYSLCMPDDGCACIKNPMQYRRKKN